MEELASQFRQRLPGGITNSDAEVLCFWLFLTADGIPEAYHPQLTREGLADMFAKLAQSGWIHQGSEPLSITESSHWNRLILCMLVKKDPAMVDLVRGKELVKSFGFGCDSPTV